MTARSLNQAYALALQLYQSGALLETKEACRLILQAAPRQPETLLLLGTCCWQSGEVDQAIDCYDAALEVNSAFAEAHFNRGLALRALGRIDEAITAYQCAARYAPNDVAALFAAGELFHGSGRGPEAAEYYRLALEKQPSHGKALNNLGILAMAEGNTKEALDFFNRAIQAEPDSAAYNNRAVALKAMDRFDEAYESYGKAIQLDPNDAEAYCNRGQLLHQMLLLDEASTDYERALAIRPNYAECHWNQALRRLLQGDFASGWEEYEWRWQLAENQHVAKPASPAWNGRQAIAGKVVLLWAEQGFGDTLQFCRYARLLAERGARVVLEVQPALVPLLQELEGPEMAIAVGTTRPAFDLHCPLLSLPGALSTNLKSIPEYGAYIRCPAAKRAQWRQGLGEKPHLRVGIVWSGSATHTRDRWRSIPLALLEPLTTIDGLGLYSLQADVRPGDQIALNALPIEYFGEALDDFSDTAALIDAMDLVISVDTSVAHLAGAMGKPTWILLPFFPDWRWMLERSDSPWYPTARLFRQAAINDWKSVIGEVRRRLLEIVAGTAPIQ